MQDATAVAVPDEESTTLAGRVAESWKGKTTVFDLERTVIREALATAPERMLGGQEGLVALDEIQRAKNVVLFID